MRLHATWHGGGHPFAGDLPLVLRALPADAVVTGAAVTVTPRSAAADRPFEERFSFGGVGATGDLAAADWGVTTLPGDGVVDVDLGARYTLAAVHGAGLVGGRLCLDLGGVLVELGPDGAVRSPDDEPFEIPPGGALPAVSAARFRIAGLQPSARVDSVTVRSRPANLTVRFGDLAPFLVRTGELAAEVTSLDAADVLRAFLPRAAVEQGVARVPLVVHSDSLCRIDLTVDIEYEQAASALPDGLPDVTLSFDLDGVPQTSGVLAWRLPPGALPSAGGTSGRAVGGFDSSRIVAENPATATGTPIALLPGAMVAAPVTVPAGTVVTAVDLQLAAITPTADLRLLVRADTSGKPLGADLLSRPVTVSLDRTAHGGPTWLSAPLPAELHLSPGRPVWLVVQVVEGEAQWSAGAAGGAVLASVDGGFSWRPPAGIAPSGAGPSTAYRLRWVPPAFEMPVSLHVGRSRVPVPLSRFEPSGRVDLDLSLPELAGAASTALADSASATCSPAEHLLDGDLAHWSSVGERLGPPVPFGTEGTATAFSASPDGSSGYVATVFLEQVRVEILDLQCGSRRVVPVGTRRIRELVTRPDGARVYGITAAAVLVLDPAGPGVRGEPVETDGPPCGVAVSADGGLLYVSTGGTDGATARVTAYDTRALEDVATSGSPLRDAVRASLELPGEPVPLGMSAGGVSSTRASGLAVLVADPQSTGQQLLVLTGRDLEQVGAPVPLPGDQGRVALTGDGTRAVAVATGRADGWQLTVVDTATATVHGSLDLDDRPFGVAVAGDGATVYVLHYSGDLLPVSLPALVPGTPVTVPLGEPLAVVALGGGGGIAVARRPLVVDRHVRGPLEEGVVVVPVGTSVPQEWTVTAGSVVPVCVPGRGRAALLGDRPSDRTPRTPATRPVATGLSQVVPVRGGCRLEFAFEGLASGTGALAEVRWLAAGCEPVREDAVPIEPVPVRSAAIGRISEPREAFRLVHHGARLSAPAGVDQAEVRFSAPPGVQAVITAASLRGSTTATTDGDLRLATAGAAQSGQGWVPDPPGSVVAASGGDTGDTSVVADDDQEARLEQVVPVTGRDAFVATFAGRVVGGTGGGFEVDWTDAAGAAVAEPVRLVIGAEDLDVVAATGEVPAAATSARVTLTVAPGSVMATRRIEFATWTPVLVPLDFASQAPGTLAVTGATVRYDVPVRPPPPVPVTGLCPAAPPGRPVPADGACHCAACGTDAVPEGSRPARTPAGRPAVAGRCARCRTPVSRVGGVPGGRAAVFRGDARGRPVPLVLPTAGSTAPGLSTGTSGHGGRPIPSVAGIGDQRLERLVRNGIATAEAVARLSMTALRDLLPGVPTAVAGDLLATARRVAAQPPPAS